VVFVEYLATFEIQIVSIDYKQQNWEFEKNL
jgi:hypothetical protein